METAKSCVRLATVVGSAVFCTVALGVPSSARSAELYNEGETRLSWDSSVTYSAAFRLGARDPALLANINADDGDRNFSPGLISDRIDFTSRIDLSRGGYGLDAGADGWYDTAYQQRNANNSPATFNPASVPHNEFSAETRSLDGSRVELADLFAYGSTEFRGLPLSFRVGRQTLLWGESLFFPQNGIAGAQAPIDEIRAATQSGAYSQGVFLPVGQASASLGVGEGMTVEAYYQFEWRPTRLPGSGSYFSTNDYLDPGGERYIFGWRRYLAETPDQSPPAAGQYGLALRFSADDIDYGLYALRFNAKEPEIVYRYAATYRYPGWRDGYATGAIGTFNRVYPADIALYGASASLAAGATNVAAELSARRNTPLNSLGLYAPAGANSVPGGYAVGDTLNGDISTITNLARNRLWDSAVLNSDVAARWRLAVTHNPGAIDPLARDVAVALRASFEPTYFEVMPHMDLTLHLGFGYGLTGYLTDDPYLNDGQGGGDVNVGITATYRVVWSGAINVTHYIGGASQQPLADRDFLSISVKRSF